MLRVAVVCFAVQPGFIDYVAGLIPTLRKGFDLKLYMGRNFDEIYGPKIGQIDFCFNRSRYLFVDYFRYILAILRWRPNILLVQAWIKLPLLESIIIYIFRLFGVKCCVTVHDVLPHEIRFWHHFTVKVYYKSFDVLIAHSQKAEVALRNLGVKGSIHVIPHGVIETYSEVQIPQQEAKRQLSLEPGAFVLLFFGHITQRKGIFPLLRAMKKLSAEKNLVLLIAGQSGLSASDDVLLNKLCDASNVILLAHHIPSDQVGLLFSACDCVILPYLEGTTSGVLKVALAFGKPVVSSHIGDVEEALEKAAVYIEGRSEIDLEEAIPSAIFDARAQIGYLKEQMVLCRERFSWDRSGQAYADVLRDL